MTITAQKILDGASKAPPFNIIRLTDISIYDRVDYSEFRSIVIGHKYEKELTNLLDTVTIMSQNVPEKSQKIYEYFILSLCQICHR